MDDPPLVLHADVEDVTCPGTIVPRCYGPVAQLVCEKCGQCVALVNQAEIDQSLIDLVAQRLKENS